jgi:hypothetical protein
VSDPGFSPANFAPGDGTRVAHAPAVHPLSAIGAVRLRCHCPRARVSCRCATGWSGRPGRPVLAGPADREQFLAPVHACGHHATELRSVLGAVQGSSLRSAHARAARGLRALTAPARSSPDSNCVMAAPCVSSGSRRSECQEIDRGCVYRIGGQDVRDGSAAPGVTPSSIGSVHGSNVVANGETCLPVSSPWSRPSDRRMVSDPALHAGLRPASVPELNPHRSDF